MKARYPIASLFLTLALASPAFAQTGVYVSQIGSGNKATVSQDARSVSGFAKIEQDGKQNEAEIIQKDGKHQARVKQTGTLNNVLVIQDGEAAHQALLSQTGRNNHINLAQTSSIAGQVATLTQTGEDNQITLSQSGPTNEATLTQTGNGNLLNLAQTGGGNVTWTQTGNDLSSVGLSVDGTQVLVITQTKP